MTDKEKEVESLSAKLHEIYMIESRRQGDVRHDWNYDNLKESTKEYDRVLARYILKREEEQSTLIESLRKENEDLKKGMVGKNTYE